MNTAKLGGVRGAVDRVSVSVVIPCYRCAGTIRRAVESVVGQSRLPLELILVDDASDDGTLQVLHEIQSEVGGDWVKVLALPENVGAGSARNAGWNAASGTYIAFLDADDAWHRRKLEIQYDFMVRHPEIALSGHAHRRIADGDHTDTALAAPDFRMVSQTQLLLSNRFVTPSSMLRRDVPQRFVEGKRHTEDQLLWLEIASAGSKVARLDEVLAFTFKAPLGDSGLTASTWKMRKAEIANVWHLYRAGHLGLIATGALCVFSLVKHVRRVLLLASR